MRKEFPDKQAKAKERRLEQAKASKKSLKKSKPKESK